MTCRPLWIFALLVLVIVGVYLPLEAFDGDEQEGFREAALHDAAGHRRAGVQAVIVAPEMSRSLAMHGWTPRDDIRGVPLTFTASIFGRHAEQLRASRRTARARLDEPAANRITPVIEVRP